MISVLKNSWALMLGMLLLMLGNGLQGTLLGVRGSIEGIDQSTLGFVMSAYFIGFLGGSKIAPELLRRVGHVRVFAALGSLVSAAFILYAAVVDPIAWFFLRLIVGFCFSGIYVVAESWINESSSNDNRGKTLSLYLMVQMAGMILGQLLLNVADPAGYGLFVLITVLVSVSFAPILLSSSRTPVYTTSRAMSIRELIRASPLACVGTLLMGGVFSILFGMAPIYATERGMSIAEVSYFITAIYAGGMLCQYPIGYLSDKIDRRLLIIASAAVGVVAAISALWIETDVTSLIVIALILGGASNPMYSLLLAYAMDYMEPDQMPAASGGLIFINGTGAMGGPIVVGYAMANFGIDWFFITLALLLSTICLYGFYRITQRNYEVPDEDAAPYLPISSRMTAAGAEFAIEAAEEESEDADSDSDNGESAQY
ncbi:MAG: MFS transporter [Granulosicoccaceae bacterium]